MHPLQARSVLKMLSDGWRMQGWRRSYGCYDVIFSKRVPSTVSGLTKLARAKVTCFGSIINMPY